MFVSVCVSSVSKFSTVVKKAMMTKKQRPTTASSGEDVNDDNRTLCGENDFDSGSYPVSDHNDFDSGS